MSRSIFNPSNKRIHCPCTPFLLSSSSSSSSKSLRSATCPLVFQSSCAYSTKTRSKYKTKLRSQQSHKSSESFSITSTSGQLDSIPLELLKFRELLLSTNPMTALDIYPRLLEQKLLDHSDTREIARLIHYGFRKDKTVMKDVDAMKDINRHVVEFVKHYKTKQLPPSPAATLHIISFYKESGQYDAGIEFWNWAVRQRSGDYVHLQTYGAAIELLAVYGQSLSYCEEVYAHALKRYPVNFNEYHLSHGAIVPKRDQPARFLGTSMVLLQGILTARLIHGDWRNAYLTLDTALRLRPTQIPDQVVSLFLRERPLNEAFQVFCTVCESGSILKSPRLTTMIDLLGSVQEADMDENHEYITAMFHALRSFIAAGGSAHYSHMNVFLQRTLLAVLEKTTDEVAPKTIDDQKLINLVSQVMAVFATLGVNPRHQTTFTSIIAVAAKSQRAVLAAWTIELLSSSDITMSKDRRRYCLVAAGESGTAPGVESLWNVHCQATHAAGESLTHDDWKVLAKAVRKTNNVKYIHRQMELHAVTNIPVFVQEMTAELEKIPVKSEEDHSPVASKLHHENHSGWFSKLLAELTSLQNMVAEHKHRNLENAPPARDTIWALPQNAAEEWSRKLYDELTLDPASQVPPITKSSPGTTGFTLDELRYRNWKAINELLIQAEVFEARKSRSIDQAIEKGMSSDEARSLNGGHRQPGKHPKLLSRYLELHLQALKDRSINTMTEAEWRDKIVTLRKASP